MDVHVKTVDLGTFIIINEMDGYNYDPYKEEWVPIKELRYFMGGRSPFAISTVDKKHFKTLFKRITNSTDMYFIFIGWNKETGVLLVSKEPMEGTVLEKW
jgi:predicted GTPase